MTFANGEVFSQTFWQPNEPRDLKIGLGRPCSETALSKLVAEQIETSIKQQMDVDVPFGAFLSRRVGLIYDCGINDEAFDKNRLIHSPSGSRIRRPTRQCMRGRSQSF